MTDTGRDQTRDELAAQSHRAFAFLDRLYREAAALIQEIERLLSLEPEKFQICCPGGYCITNQSSTSLNPASVPRWLLRRFCVSFVSDEVTEVKGGVTRTALGGDLAAFVLHATLDDPNEPSRLIVASVRNIEGKDQNRKRWENYLWVLVNRDDVVFSNTEDWKRYEDSYVAFDIKSVSVPMLGLNSTDDVKARVVDPGLALFRQ